MKNILLPLLALTSFQPLSADEAGVRLHLGIGDREATDWTGTVAVSPGKVTLVNGWRFAQQDRVDGVSGWSCRTRPAALDQRRSNNPQRQQKRAAVVATTLPMSDDGVLISLADVAGESRISVKTAKGEFSFKVADVPFGKISGQLGGAVKVERTAAPAPFASDARTEDDRPGGAGAPDGTVRVMWPSPPPSLARPCAT